MAAEQMDGAYQKVLVAVQAAGIGVESGRIGLPAPRVEVVANQVAVADNDHGRGFTLRPECGRIGGFGATRLEGRLKHALYPPAHGLHAARELLRLQLFAHEVGRDDVRQRDAARIGRGLQPGPLDQAVGDGVDTGHELAAQRLHLPPYGRIGRHQHGPIDVRDKFDERAAAHITGHDGRRAGVQIQNRLVAHTEAVAEPDFLPVERIEQGQVLLLAAQRVQTGVAGGYEPQQLAALHDILVDTVFFYIGKGLGGTRHNEQVVGVERRRVAEGPAFGAVEQTQRLAHRQRAAERPFALPFEKGHALRGRVFQQPDGLDELQFQIFDAAVERALGVLAQLGLQQVERKGFVAYRQLRARENQPPVHTLFRLDFELGGLQALFHELADERVALAGFGVVDVDETVAQVGPVAAEFVEQLAQALFHAFERGRQIARQIDLDEHGRCFLLEDVF